jgi:hypothetical protein
VVSHAQEDRIVPPDQARSASTPRNAAGISAPAASSQRAQRGDRCSAWMEAIGSATHRRGPRLQMVGTDRRASLGSHVPNSPSVRLRFLGLGLSEVPVITRIFRAQPERQYMLNRTCHAQAAAVGASMGEAPRKPATAYERAAPSVCPAPRFADAAPKEPVWLRRHLGDRPPWRLASRARSGTGVVRVAGPTGPAGS